MLPTCLFGARFLSLINHRGERCFSCVDGYTPCLLFICVLPGDISNLSTWSLVLHAFVTYFWTHFPNRNIPKDCFSCYIQIHRCHLVFTLLTNRITYPQIWNFVSDWNWNYHRDQRNCRCFRWLRILRQCCRSSGRSWWRWKVWTYSWCLVVWPNRSKACWHRKTHTCRYTDTLKYVNTVTDDINIS